MIKQVELYISELSLREKVLLWAGILVLVAAGFYAGIAEPLFERNAAAKIEYDAQLNLNRWLDSIPKVSGQLKTERAKTFRTQAASVSVVEESLKATSLRQALKRLEPNQDSLIIQLSDAEFLSLIEWIKNARRQLGYVVSEAQFRHAEAPGRVKAQLKMFPVHLISNPKP